MEVQKFAENLPLETCFQLVEAFEQFEKTGVLPDELLSKTKELIENLGADPQKQVFWAEQLAKASAFRVVRYYKTRIAF